MKWWQNLTHTHWLIFGLVALVIAMGVAYFVRRARLDKQARELAFKDFAVDLTKYAGRWHEVARLPNTFQKQCESCVVAQYTLQKDTDANSKILVKNTCTKVGQMQTDTNDDENSEADGVATVVQDNFDAAKQSQNYNSWLKVSFVPWVRHFNLDIFAGDYVIAHLDKDYSHAIVGSPDRASMWFLSRASQTSKENMERLSNIATDKGFDLQNMIVTKPCISK